MTAEIKRMLAEREELEAKSVINETDRLFEEEEWRNTTKRIRYHMNHGWRPDDGWLPFELFICFWSALKTEPHVPAKLRKERAETFWRVMVREARCLWRDGFYANPFARQPRWREDLAPWAWPALTHLQREDEE